ncbi:hypothetical protein D3C78_1104440 [compost metagenome]
MGCLAAWAAMLVVVRYGGVAMGLNRPTQQLRRELLDMASRNEGAAIELVHAAELLPDAQALALMRVVGALQEDADRLTAIAAEIAAGRVVAAKGGAG